MWCDIIDHDFPNDLLDSIKSNDMHYDVSEVHDADFLPLNHLFCQYPYL